MEEKSKETAKRKNLILQRLCNSALEESRITKENLNGILTLKKRSEKVWNTSR